MRLFRRGAFLAAQEPPWAAQKPNWAPFILGFRVFFRSVTGRGPIPMPDPFAIPKRQPFGGMQTM
jgi:hypothetical protein